jgi:hypothetical protein
MNSFRPQILGNGLRGQSCAFRPLWAPRRFGRLSPFDVLREPPIDRCMNQRSLLTAPTRMFSAELFALATPSKAKINYRLQYLRAIAAISVVLCHASYYLMAARGDSWLWNIFVRAGLFCVMLFFAISGHLMAQLGRSRLWARSGRTSFDWRWIPHANVVTAT